VHPEIARARRALEEGRAQEARAALEALDPKSLPPGEAAERALCLARACVESTPKDPDAALAALERGLEVAPNDARLVVTRGIVLSEAARYEEAEKVLARAVVLAPDDPLAHYNRGVVRERKGALDKALRSYSRALSLDPQSLAARARRAWTLKKLGRFEEARTELEAYLERAPNDAHEWVTLGIVRSDLGAYEEAEQAFARAIRVDPRNVSARFNAVITARRRKDLEAMSRLVDELKSIARDDRRVGWASAILAGERGRLDEACALYARALRRVLIEPEVPEGEAGALGEWAFPALKRANRAADARALWEEALRRGCLEARFLQSYARSFGRQAPRGIRVRLFVRSRGPGDPPTKLARELEVCAESLDEAWELSLEVERLLGQEGVERGEVLGEEKISKDDGPFPIGVRWIGAREPEAEAEASQEPEQPGFEPEKGWSPEDESTGDREEGGGEDGA
jgi:tetratricopeptide (TPR) repeat protein